VSKAQQVVKRLIEGDEENPLDILQRAKAASKAPRRYLVPAVFVVDIRDTDDPQTIAAAMQSAANDLAANAQYEAWLMLDEKLPTVEIPWQQTDDYEIPGSYQVEPGFHSGFGLSPRKLT
jgi:hypothetical protein